MKKLDQKGVAHYILPLIVVAIVVAVGVKVLTSSHADQITLTTVTTPALGNNTAVLSAASSATGGSVGQSSVPYTLMGSQSVVYLAPGQSLSFNNGVKGNEQSCFYFYVSQPKAGTANVTLQIASNNNSRTLRVSSTLDDNLKQACVGPGTGQNPGFSVKNATPATQIGNVEILSETLKW